MNSQGGGDANSSTTRVLIYARPLPLSAGLPSILVYNETAPPPGMELTQFVCDERLTAESSFSLNVVSSNSFGTSASSVPTVVTMGKACTPPCLNDGLCVKGSCSCTPRWTGPACATKACIPACSATGGTCDDGVCKCSALFKGPTCSESICPSGCSGHGKCMATGKCECDAGFRGEKCTLVRCPYDCYNAGVCTDSGVCVCPASRRGVNCEYGLSFNLTSPVITRAGKSSSISFWLDVAPTAEVIVPLSVSSPVDASISVQTLRFDAGSTAGSVTAARSALAAMGPSPVITAQVKGLPGNSGNVDASLSIIIGIMQSKDASFQGLDPEDIPFRNVAVIPPLIKGTDPGFCPLVGCGIVVSGTLFEPGASWWVGDVEVTSTAVFQSESSYTMVAPAVAARGYYTIKIVNPSGGESSLVQSFYMSSDCPETGTAGSGENCVACPEGATCPGGGRLVPKAGYWAPTDGATYAIQCHPPSACQEGGACGVGYEGDFCSQCSKGFYLNSGNCEPCGSVNYFWPLLIVMCIFFGLMIWAMCVAHDFNLSNIVHFLTTVQLIGAVGSTASYNLPRFLQSFYGWLKVLSLDYSFVRGGCSSKTTFSALFFFNILIFAIVLILSLSVIGLLMVFVKKKREFYSLRVYRVAVIVPTIFFPVITSRSLQALYCVRVGGEYRLKSELAVECRSGDHKAVLAVAILLLIFYVVGFPLGFFLKIYRNRHRIWVDHAFKSRFGSIYESYSSNLPYFGFSNMVVYLALGLVKTFLLYDKGAQMGVCVAILGVYLSGTLFLKPLKYRWKQAISALSIVVSILGVITNYCAFDPTNPLAKSAPGLAYATVTLSVILIIGWCLVFFYFTYFHKGTHSESIEAEVLPVADVVQPRSKVGELAEKESTPAEILADGTESDPAPVSPTDSGGKSSKNLPALPKDLRAIQQSPQFLELLNKRKEAKQTSEGGARMAATSLTVSAVTALATGSRPPSALMNQKRKSISEQDPVPTEVSGAENSPLPPLPNLSQKGDPSTPGPKPSLPPTTAKRTLSIQAASQLLTSQAVRRSLAQGEEPSTRTGVPPPPGYMGRLRDVVMGIVKMKSSSSSSGLPLPATSSSNGSATELPSTGSSTVSPSRVSVVGNLPPLVPASATIPSLQRRKMPAMPPVPSPASKRVAKPQATAQPAAATRSHTDYASPRDSTGSELRTEAAIDTAAIHDSSEYLRQFLKEHKNENRN